MKKLISLIAVLVLVAVFAALPASAGVTDNPRVIDNADLLTDQEEQELTEQLKEYSDKNDCDIVFLTEPDLKHGNFSFDGSVEDYADMYYESHGYDKDGVLVLRVLDKGNGKPRIQFSCSGKCIKRLTEDEQNEIIDLVESDLTAGRYYQAFSTMASEISDSIPIRLKWYMLPLAILIGFAIAMLIMFIIRGKLKTVAMQRGAASYVRPGSMHVTASRDTYLYSTVSRTARESSSSGSSGRTSSGGGSHSGVGRDV